jgi:hypothetical protein
MFFQEPAPFKSTGGVCMYVYMPACLPSLAPQNWAHYFEQIEEKRGEAHTDLDFFPFLSLPPLRGGWKIKEEEEEEEEDARKNADDIDSSRIFDLLLLCRG